MTPRTHRIKKCDRLVECIRAHPGLTAHEIAEQCDMNASRVTQLLCWVKRVKGTIRSDKAGQKLRFYPTGQTIGDVARKHLNVDVNGRHSLKQQHLATTLAILQTCIGTPIEDLALRVHKEAIELAWGGK